MLSHLRTSDPAGESCGVALQRVEAVNGKSFRVVFSLGDLYLATFTFLDDYVDGGNHGLTGIFVQACLTVIEYIPLTVDLAD